MENMWGSVQQVRVRFTEYAPSLAASHVVPRGKVFSGVLLMNGSDGEDTDTNQRVWEEKYVLCIKDNLREYLNQPTDIIRNNDTIQELHKTEWRQTVIF